MLDKGEAMSVQPVSQTAPQLAEQAVSALGAQLRGELILPADPRYEDVRKVYNAMIDKRPALIARCADVADVIHAVNFGRDNQLTVAVRGGGHNGPGLGTCDDGLMIDLSRMRGIRVDPSDKTVRVQGGCVWGDVDHATHAFGLAVPSGILASTGVGGLTLGGGIGYLARNYGLTIDNLLSVDMVLADGKFVTASATENADLFWAVRGGGGNFGVVTSFLFKANPVQTVYGGPCFGRLNRRRTCSISGRISFSRHPTTSTAGSLLPRCRLLRRSLKGIIFRRCVQLCGATPVIQQMARQLSNPSANSAHPRSISPVQSLTPLCKACLTRCIRPVCNGIGARISSITSMTRPLTCTQNMAHNCPLCSQPCISIPSMAQYTRSVSGYRLELSRRQFCASIVGVDPDPKNNERLAEWAKDYWLALHPFSAGGAYVNMIMDEGEERVKAAYRDNYTRLAQIKAKYDPHNFFHVNQNIKPAA
jgi:hypothetical protein